MSTNSISLTPSQWAYTDSWYPNQNYSNTSELFISNSFNPSIGGHGDSKAIIQFYISNDVTGSKLNSAVLNFDMTYWWNITQHIEADEDYLTNLKIYYSSAITNGYICNDVTHSNYSTLVTQGTKNEIKASAKYLTYASNQIDITSIVSNNITDNIFTIVIETPPVQPRKISSSSITLGLTYEQVDPVTPVIIAPNGTYENKSKDIKFEWIYKSQTEATQASAMLEYRQGSSGSYSTVNIYNSNNYYVMPANTLSGGIIEWRVKTTDSDGKVSDYACGSFTVISSPAVPIITSVDNKCISNIKWSSADQVAYEIEIYKGNDLVLSKKVSSSENNFTPNMFFANTTYTIKLRVCNMYGLWSEWGSKVVTLSFANPTAPSISVSQDNANVIITTDTQNAILYKSDDGINFIPIYKFNDSKSYTDYRVAHNTKYKYFIRKFDTGYTDSVIESAQIKIKGIILQNDTNFINATQSAEQYMNFDETISIDKSNNYYSGREYAVAEFGEHKSRTISRDILITPIQYQILKQMYLSATVITYRDSRGNIMSCTIEGISVKNAILDSKYQISISLSQVEESEEVNLYD